MPPPSRSSSCNSELVISFHFHVLLKVKLNVGSWRKDVISSRNSTSSGSRHTRANSGSAFPVSGHPAGRRGPTEHDQVHDALLVATRVGGVLADVAALVAHADVADLDGWAGQVGGVDQEADPALHGRVGVVGLEFGVQHGDVDPFAVLWLVDPSHLRAEGPGVTARGNGKPFSVGGGKQRRGEFRATHSVL